MTTVHLPTTGPPAVQDLPRLVNTANVDPARDRQLEGQLRSALAALRGRRKMRRLLEAERARREHERTTQRALLLFGQLHVR